MTANFTCQNPGNRWSTFWVSAQKEEKRKFTLTGTKDVAGDPTVHITPDTRLVGAEKAINMESFVLRA